MGLLFGLLGAFLLLSSGGKSQRINVDIGPARVRQGVRVKLGPARVRQGVSVKLGPVRVLVPPDAHEAAAVHAIAKSKVRRHKGR